MTVACPHDERSAGQVCPKCDSARLHAYKDRVVVIIHGQAPFTATGHVCEQSRCPLCGEIFTAPTPEGVNLNQKYDPGAIAAAALNLIELLKYLAAEQPLFYQDDTSARVLELIRENRSQPPPDRCGQVTTGIIAHSAE